MNLYGYAGGDPINNSDPFGLCPDEKQKNTICVSFFIESSTAGPLKGDGRGFQTSSSKDQSRAWIVVDVENQSIVDKGFSSTCMADGSDCSGPSFLSQIGASFGSNGVIDVSVVGHNSKTIVPAFSGSIRFSPDGNGGYQSQGFATRFPSIEAYYHNGAGQTQTLIQRPGSHPACLALCGVGPIRQ